MIETRIAVALVNATWQSCIVAAVATTLLRLFGRTNASVRCVVWCAVLGAVAVLPAIDVIGGQVVRTTATAAMPASAAATQAGLARSFARRERTQVTTAGTPALRPASGILHELEREATLTLDRAAVALFWLWLSGAAICGARLLYALGALQATRRRFEPLCGDWLAELGERRNLPVAASRDVAVPCLVGFVTPTVVVPHPLSEELGANDLRRIVLHEAAHAQRLDHWTNLFVQIVRAVLFFNPVVYYVAGRIAIEREIACDDRVIEVTGDRVVYAACLSEIARTVSLGGAHAVPGFFAGRAQIVVRIEELLDRAHDGSSRLGRKPLIAIGALVVLAVATAHFGIPVVAATVDASVRAAVTAKQAAPVRATESVRPVEPSVRQRPVAATLARTAGPPAPRAAAAIVRDVRVAPTHVVVRAEPAHDIGAVQPTREKTVALAPVNPAVAAASQPVARSLASSASSSSNASSYSSASSESSASDQSSSSSGDDFIDSLAAAGYRGLSANDLIRLRDHGVDGPFVAAMNAAAKRRLSPDELIALRDHGVDVRLVDAMRRSGYPISSVSTLIELADHGVNPEFVSAMAGLLGRIAPDDLIKLRDHGVDQQFVAAMLRAQVSGLSVDQLVRLRDHGVDAEFVAHVRGYFSRPPTVEELIKMKDNGL